MSYKHSKQCFFIGPKHHNHISVFASKILLLGFLQRDLLSQWQVDLCSFIQWLGADPTVALHLKEVLHRIQDRLNRTMAKKIKKKSKANRKKHFAGIRIHKFCLQSWALNPLLCLKAVPNTFIMRMNLVFVCGHRRKSKELLEFLLFLLFTFWFYSSFK